MNTLVDLPLEAKEPLELHGVEISDGNAADFSPGAVLEGVVVEELAAEQEAGSEHTVDLSGSRCRRRRRRCLDSSRVDVGGGEHPHARGQVVEAEEDGGARQTRRRKDLGDVFAELRGRRGSWVDASEHVNICKH